MSPRITSNGSARRPASSAISDGVQDQALIPPAMKSGALPSQPARCATRAALYSGLTGRGEVADHRDVNGTVHSGVAAPVSDQVRKLTHPERNHLVGESAVADFRPP